MSKKSKNSFLEKSFRYLVLFAPAILFFSYYPNFHFGSNDSMNFEISLSLIWLVIFDVISLVLIIKKRLFANIFKYWPWLLFPIFLTLSVFWSLNSLRGFLTVSILWLIYFAGFSLFKFKNCLIYIFLIRF